jgi:hypothetical protein
MLSTAEWVWTLFHEAKKKCKIHIKKQHSYTSYPKDRSYEERPWMPEVRTKHYPAAPSGEESFGVYAKPG